IKKFIQNLSLPRKIDFMLKISKAIELTCNGLEAMTERIQTCVVSVLKENEDTISLLLTTLMQYQSISPTAMAILLSTLCWLRLGSVTVATILKVIFSERCKMTPFIAHMSRVVLSFNSAVSLQAEHDLVGEISTKLSSCL